MSRPVNIGQNDVKSPDWLARWLTGFRTWVDELMADRPRSKLVTIRSLSGARGSMALDSGVVPFVVGGCCVVGVRNLTDPSWTVPSASPPPFALATRGGDGRLSLAWFFMPSTGIFDLTVCLFEG